MRLAMCLAGALLLSACGRSDEVNGYRRAVGNLYPNVRLYNGQNAQNLISLGTMTDFYENAQGRRVIELRTDRGNEDWMYRDEVLNNPDWYWVKADDPGLKR